MSEAMDTELRGRLTAVPADPPTDWSADLRARLLTAWAAEESETDSNPVTVSSPLTAGTPADPPGRGRRGSLFA